jgi:hypothetical protein
MEELQAVGSQDAQLGLNRLGARQDLLVCLRIFGDGRGSELCLFSDHVEDVVSNTLGESTGQPSLFFVDVLAVWPIVCKDVRKLDN